MSILTEAKSETAYLKMGIYGEAGSGKTFTSSNVAIGLHRLIKSDKPVAFADTETGSDFIKHLFDAAGIKLMVAKTRAFIDLLGIVDEAEKTCSVLIVDSVTHYWNELLAAYLKKNNKMRLALKDWTIIKPTWREFTDRYVNSKLHVIICGRSADKWDTVEDADGSSELRKVGTKMRTETEMGYEPSLLVEMEAIQTAARAEAGYVHMAYVKKDRFDVINGKEFTDPGFESFLPHVQLLNLGGEHHALDTNHDSQAIFDDPRLGEKRMLNREILVEKIEAEIRVLYPGQTQENVQARFSLMERVFGTKSWKEIERLVPADKLEFGLGQLVDMRMKANDNGGNGKPPAEEKPKPIPAQAKSKKGGSNAHVA